MYVVVFLIPVVIVAGLLGRYILRSPSPPPVLGVYRIPGRWYLLKLLLAYTVLLLRKWKNGQPRKEVAGKRTPGYGVKSKACIETMEQPQPLSGHPKAIDAVYVSGFGRDGTYVVTATGRCPNQKINGFAFLRLPKIGLLKLPTLPDSVLDASEEMAFSAEGILIKPIQPMKRWQVNYDGPMKFENDDKHHVHVTMSLEFMSDLHYFDCDTDIPPLTMARALAREPWSRAYFQHLKEAHQTHYEQMGALKGTVTIEGYGNFQVNLHGYRDHSYGKGLNTTSILPILSIHHLFFLLGFKREWSYMHRYGLHTVALEDNTMFTVGIISQPITLSTLEMGYLYKPNGKLYAIDWCDLPLYCHGENGNPPMDYAFRFQAGGETYLMQVNVIDLSHLNMGLDWEARFVERFCHFTVNGLQGWGISEWEYRRFGGRQKLD